MSFADKLIEIANNTPKVVTAVNAKKSYASGSGCLRLNSVCDIEHDLIVKVMGEGSERTTISRYGKNLIFPTCGKGEIYGVNYTTNGNGEIILNGSTTYQYGSTIFILGNSTSNGLLNYYVKDNLILSGCPQGGSVSTYRLMARIQSPNGTTQYPQDNGNGILIPKGSKIDYLYINVPSVKDKEGKETNILNNIVFKPQLEIGNAKTEFEVYKEPLTVAVDSNGYLLVRLQSLSPTTSLIANENDVTIEAKYFDNENKKTCENLTNLNIILKNGVRGAE